MKKEAAFFQCCPVTEPEAVNTDIHRRLSEHKETLFFTVRLAEHLQRLPREVVEKLKIYLDMVMCNGAGWAR